MPLRCSGYGRALSSVPADNHSILVQSRLQEDYKAWQLPSISTSSSSKAGGGYLPIVRLDITRNCSTPLRPKRSSIWFPPSTLLAHERLRLSWTRAYAGDIPSKCQSFSADTQRFKRFQSSSAVIAHHDVPDSAHIRGKPDTDDLKKRIDKFRHELQNFQDQGMKATKQVRNSESEQVARATDASIHGEVKPALAVNSRRRKKSIPTSDVGAEGLTIRKVSPARGDGRFQETLKAVNTLFQQWSSSVHNAHFDNYGRERMKRKDRVVTRKQALSRAWHQVRDLDVMWENVSDFMKVHTNSNPHRSALLVSGHPSALGYLQSKLRDLHIKYEPIVRFGRTFKMLLSGPKNRLSRLSDFFKESNLIQVLEDTDGAVSDPLVSLNAHQPSQHLPTEELVAGTTDDPRQQFLNQVIHLTKFDSSLDKTSIIEKLVILFDDAQASEVVSYKSLRVAINYLLRHSAILQANTLFSQASAFGLAPSTRTYNVFLRGCAKEQNLRAFKFFVEKMVSSGLKLDGSSWIAFLELSPKNAQKARILRYMRHQALLANDNARCHVAAPIIRASLGSFLENGGAMSDYLSSLEELCGRHWRTPAAVSALLGQLIARDNVHESFDVLKQMENGFGFLPNIDLLNLIVKQYHTQRDSARLVQVVREFMRLWPFVRPNETTMHTVFKLASDQRYYSMARTAWKYACALGLTNDEMRNAVFQSLWRIIKSALDPTQGLQVKSNRDKWLYTSGCVIIGKSPPHPTGEGQPMDSNQNVEDVARQEAYAWVGADMEMKDEELSWQSFPLALGKAWAQDCRLAGGGMRHKVQAIAAATGNPWVAYQELAELEG